MVYGIDQRKQRRVDVKIKFRLRTEEITIITETLNLSTSGLLCQLDRHIPLDTHIELKLALPLDKKGEQCEYLTCYGYIIRVQVVLSKKGEAASYMTAICMDEMEVPVKMRLEKFLNNINYSG